MTAYVAGALSAAAVSASAEPGADAAAPTLDLKLDAPRELDVGGETMRLDGDFIELPDGSTALGIGEDFGLSIPAAPFFGESGTLAFTLRYVDPAPEHRMQNRHIVFLRFKGPGGTPDGMLGFYFIKHYRKLELSYRKLSEKFTLQTPTLAAGRSYRLAATWDGATVSYYLDGTLLGERKQGFPARFPDYARLHIGPYEDRRMPGPRWGANDVSVGDLKVWKRPLDPLEIGADAGVEVASAETRFPPFLSVPQSAAPVMDGSLDEPAWKRAASFVSLVDQSRPERSLSYPHNRPLFLHDGKNLYVGFRSVFPHDANLIQGPTRAPGEPDVQAWGSESFEFFVEVDRVLYRFAGNLAGGYTESRSIDRGFEGPWTYATTHTVPIDGSHHWHGEIRIPFKTLGLQAPVGKDIKVNFCRTWCTADEMGMTSLQYYNGEAIYGDSKRFAVIRPAESSEGGLVRACNDPSYGDLSQEILVHGAGDGEFSYTVKAVNSLGEGSVVASKKAALRGGEQTELAAVGAVTSTSARFLLCRLEGPGGNLLMQQLLPFRLKKDYLDVTPVFGAGKLLLTPRHSILKSSAPSAAFTVRLLGPAGQMLHSEPLVSDRKLDVPFARDNPAGDYRAEIVSGRGDALVVHSSETFHYTGRAPWENLPPVDIIPAPFEALQVQQAGGQTDVTVWGRRYRFERSLLPVSIRTQGHELLSSPGRLDIGGEAVSAGRFTVKSRTPMRVEFSATHDSEACLLNQEAWIEYDGVFFTRLQVQARRDLGAVTLSLPMPTQAAKFMHATASGFGYGGRQNRWLDTNHELPFYPSVWVGNEERGLAWFAESANGWNTRDRKPLKVVREGDTTRLQVTFADGMAAGSRLDLEFGLLATPVKPLPANYPLNTFAGFNHPPMDNPETPYPVIYSSVANWEAAGFWDLPLGEEEPETWTWLQDHFDTHERCRAILTPYNAAVWLEAEYPELASRLAEWQLGPAGHRNYSRGGKAYQWCWCCPETDAANFFLWKFDQVLEKMPLRGIYLDFGPAYRCSNSLHGCNNRTPLLAQRRFYQRLAALFAKRGLKDYVILVHNSQTVQWPTFTHATHFLNGEQIRQMSSSTLHGGKDMLDTYTRLEFAMELSSHPFGITSSVYVPVDPLLPAFGGGDEPWDLYHFRMTKAAMAGTLVHGTIPSVMGLHYGWFNKLVRIYGDFDVPRATFLPYWRNSDSVRVIKGKDVFVSLYRAADRPEFLAAIAHLSTEHLDQDVELEIDPATLGLSALTRAEEMLTAPDPEYERLYERRRDAGLEPVRVTLDLGDFGVKNVRLEGNRLKLHLDFHSVALVKVTGRPENEAPGKLLPKG